MDNCPSIIIYSQFNHQRYPSAWLTIYNSILLSYMLFLSSTFFNSNLPLYLHVNLLIILISFSF